MEYYRYDFAQPILPQLTRHAKAASELAVLCKSLGITGLYQNHAGKNMVGAALWDLQDVLLDLDPSALGTPPSSSRKVGLPLTRECGLT